MADKTFEGVLAEALKASLAGQEIVRKRTGKKRQSGRVIRLTAKRTSPADTNALAKAIAREMLEQQRPPNAAEIAAKSLANMAGAEQAKALHDLARVRYPTE